MNIKLTPFHFEELIQRGFSLDLIFILRLIHEQADMTKLREDNAKIELLYQTLIRKELLTEDGKLTLMGQELLAFMDSKISRRIKKNAVDDSDFNKWWDLYPGTDTFVYKDCPFTGSRSLRANKEECRTKFEKILGEGEYSLVEMIAALELDIHQKKEASLKSRTNKLTYMQNSLTYLNQRSFEGFIELVRAGAVIIESPEASKGYTEI